MYSKILVPYDGSKLSNNALSHAISLAKMVISTNSKKSSSLLAKDKIIAKTSRSSSPEVILLYVIEEVHVPPSFDYGMKIKSPLDNGEIKTIHEYMKEVYHNLKLKAMEMLNKKKIEYSASNIPIRTDAVVGHRPADKIIEFASNHNADIIVMGTYGLSGISRIKALGSVSRSVVERAECPVLLVH